MKPVYQTSQAWRKRPAPKTRPSGMALKLFPNVSSAGSQGKWLTHEFCLSSAAGDVARVKKNIGENKQAGKDCFFSWDCPSVEAGHAPLHLCDSLEVVCLSVLQQYRNLVPQDMKIHDVRCTLYLVCPRYAQQGVYSQVKRRSQPWQKIEGYSLGKSSDFADFFSEPPIGSWESEVTALRSALSSVGVDCWRVSSRHLFSEL